MEAHSTPIESAQRKSRILIVDDEPSICTLLVEGLSAEGFECQAANCGREAFDILELERFDALICDLRMPGVSGLSVLEVARSQYPRMACLVATGVDDVRVSVEAMKLGADDCIVKPFRLETIALAVERALHEKRLELEVEAHRKQLEQTAKAQTEQLQAAVESIQQMYDEIQRTSEETAKELSAALAAKHNDTDQHAHGVTHYSVEIAKALGCTPEQLNLISRGSYLHDIGKIGIPDAILNKPGKLTPQEVALMQTHPRKGYEIICRIPFLKEAAEIVLSHHERFDGRGYPRGLTGDDIPLGARIVAVAEAFDVLICDQPYRKGLDLEDAVAEIRRSSGAQFDPKAVTAFLDWVKIHGHHRARHSQRDAVSGDPLEPSRPA